VVTLVTSHCVALTAPLVDRTFRPRYG